MTYTRQLKYLDLVLKNGRAPHAFLFYGRDAAFQKKTAVDFLIRLNGSKEAAAIKAEVHPDVFFVRRLQDKKDVSITQIRDVKNFVSRTPVSLEHKGVFVEDAQYLNEEGWNALLKTLEEPSAGTTIFILSSSLKNIPPTIVSRVVSLPFSNPVFNPSLAKDDIIIDKLAELENLPVADRFDLAEDLAGRENSAEIMDHWLLALRTKMLEKDFPADKLAATAAVKDVILSTNANARLALESLFLKF